MTLPQEIVHAFVLQLFALQSSQSMSDNSIEITLKLVKLLLSNMATKLSIDHINTVLDHFPSSLYKAKKEVGLDENTSVRYVTCPNCFSNYDPSSTVIEERSGDKITKKSATCTHARFPDHVQARMREECGTELMKTVCSVDGKTNYFDPKQIYSYQPVKDSLQTLISRKEIRDKLMTSYHKVMMKCYLTQWMESSFVSSKTIEGTYILQTSVTLVLS